MIWFVPKLDIYEAIIWLFQWKFVIFKQLGWLDNHYKSDIKRRNIIDCIDQYTDWEMRLGNSQDRETVFVYKYVHRMETVNFLDRVAVYLVMAIVYLLW